MGRSSRLGGHRLSGRRPRDAPPLAYGRCCDEVGTTGSRAACTSTWPRVSSDVRQVAWADRMSQASGRPLDAVARRSPGAVISAIQVRTAMQGVLIPWRKNRPEDTTTGWNCCMPIVVVCTSIQDRGFMWTCLSWILPASSQASSPRETSPLRPLDAPRCRQRSSLVRPA